MTRSLSEVTLWQNQVSEVESILTVGEKERPGAQKCWCLLSSEERGGRCLDPYLEAENFQPQIKDPAFESPTLPVSPLTFALLSGPTLLPPLPVSVTLKVRK